MLLGRSQGMYKKENRIRNEMWRQSETYSIEYKIAIQ